MFSVVTKAKTTALTTLPAVKLALGVSDSADDKWLQTQIDLASIAICNYLGVEMAEDGSRTLGRETVTETFDRRSRYPYIQPFGVVVPRREADSTIVLAKRPVVSIGSIAENGTAVDPADYELFATTGVVKRLSSYLLAAWPCTIVTVTYTAGWLLPGDENRNLPVDIEQAAITYVQAQVGARKRDPNVKSVNIPGVRQVDYFYGTPGLDDQMLPIAARAMLNPYRSMSL